jgi:2-phospho-L-lactate guanylyltransferase
MTMWAVVPVKRLDHSKERLAGALSPKERRALVLGMLDDVLSALSACRSIAAIAVVGSDDEVAQIAELHGASFVREQEHDLNSALEQAARELECDEAMLVVPADVPLLDPADVESIVRRHPPQRPSLSLVPDRHRERTAALLASPPCAIAFRFGPDSFAEHQRAAQRAGAALTLLELDNLALDVDTEEDLALVLARRQIGAELP